MSHYPPSRCRSCGNKEHIHWAAWGEWVCNECYWMWRRAYDKILARLLYGKVA